MLNKYSLKKKRKKQFSAWGLGVLRSFERMVLEGNRETVQVRSLPQEMEDL